MIHPDQFKETFNFNQEPIWAISTDVLWPIRGLHIHNGLEVGVVNYGQGTLNLNGLRYPLQTGTIFFFDASVPHWHLREQSTPLHLNIVVFPAMSIPAFSFEKNDIRLLEPFLAARIGFPPVLKPQKSINSLIDEIIQLYQQKKEHWDLLVLPKLTQVLVYIACETLPLIKEKKPQFSSQVSAITDAIYFMNSHYRESFSIDTLANLCHLSTSHFSHLFTEIVGLSPLKYRDRLRIAYAIERLLFSHDKASLIAMECGFSDEAHFSKIFRSITGSPPSEYRKRS